MLEYWNVGLNKEATHFIASLSRGILQIYHYPIFPEPIIPTFQLRSGAKFVNLSDEVLPHEKAMGKGTFRFPIVGSIIVPLPEHTDKESLHLGIDTVS